MKMANNRFENRVFGAVLIKSVVANYNADFTGSPRTLPSGVIYATDKALKYCIRNYLKKEDEIIFYTTRYKKKICNLLILMRLILNCLENIPK